MAYTFNGTADAISLSDLNGLGDFTVAMRFYVTANSTGTTNIFASDTFSNTGYSGNRQVVLFRSNEGTMGSNAAGMIAGINGAAVTFVSTGVAPTLNAWHTLVGRRSGLTGTATLDGGTGGNGAAQASASIAAVSTDLVNFSEPRIGCHYSSNANAEFFPGSACDVAIWNVELTDAEVLSYYQGVTPLLIRPSALQVYMPTVADINDRMRSAGTALIGAPAVSAHPIVYTARTFQLPFMPAPRAWSESLTETFSISDSLTKALTKALSDGVTFTDTLVKAFTAALSDTIAFSDALTKSPGKVITDAISFTDAVATLLNIGVSLSDTLPLNDALSSLLAFGVSLTDTLQINEAFQKGAIKALTESFAISDQIAKGVSKAVSDTFPLLDAMTQDLIVIAILSIITTTGVS